MPPPRTGCSRRLQEVAAIVRLIWARVNGAFLRLRLVSSAIIHRGESLNRAANAEGMSRSGMIRNIVKRYLRERSEKVQESP